MERSVEDGIGEEWIGEEERSGEKLRGEEWIGDEERCGKEGSSRGGDEWRGGEEWRGEEFTPREQSGVWT